MAGLSAYARFQYLDFLFEEIDLQVGPRYTLLRQLGQGSFGEVAEGFDTVLSIKVKIYNRQLQHDRTKFFITSRKGVKQNHGIS